MIPLVLDLSDVTAAVVTPDDGAPYLLLTLVSCDEVEVRLVPGSDWGEALGPLWMLVDRLIAFSALLEGRHRA